MQGKLVPYFIEITKDTCLKSFWRKRSLRTFLRQNHISSNALSDWSSDESKRNFLDRLFERLIAQKDNRGYSVILTMAKNLANQNSFPDLEGWEDSQGKIKSAVDAVNLLRVELAKIEGQIQEKEKEKRRREEAEKRKVEIISSGKSLETLKGELDKLANKIGTQQAGYEFQKWFYDLVDYFELERKRSYNTGGRQIDGTLTLDGTTFLVELKFTTEPMGAPDIDGFYRKVTSKSDNTMGIYVSMSGFKDGAKQAASGEKTPLVLMDFKHLYYVLGGAMTLGEVISRIKRHASQTAEAYLAIEDFGK